jgi:RNA polymerase sigma-70 factor, ECF subfamily
VVRCALGIEDRAGSTDSMVSWAALLRLIALGETGAFESLYSAFGWVRNHFLQQIGDDGDDLYNELMLDLYQKICQEQLRDPERLAGYVRVMAAHKLANHIQRVSSVRHKEQSTDNFDVPDRRSDPESAALQAQYKRIAVKVMMGLPVRQREMLIRFYIREQTAEQIQAEMSLTATQFRLVKSRAKARFAELCQARIERVQSKNGMKPILMPGLLPAEEGES